MNSFEQSWKRLVAHARRATPASAAVEPPVGFVTRVAALSLAARREGPAGIVWEWLALRGLGIACAVAVLSIAVVWPLASGADHNEMADLADPLMVADASR